MKIPRLYLVRVSFQTIKGPFTAEELIKAHQAMEYNLQDEVCGNLGRWVSFDDIESISVEYPELFDIVQKNLLAGWVETDTKIIRGNSSTSLVKLVLLPIALTLFFLVIWGLWKRKELQLRFFASRVDCPKGEKVCPPLSEPDPSNEQTITLPAP